MFDVAKLTNFAVQKIETFGVEHPNEVFYGFCIDSSLLCFNTVEFFESKLKEYKLKWPTHYQTTQQIQKFKYNPGNWVYQGFANFAVSEEDALENGYDLDLYDAHYYAEDKDQPTSEYAKSINAVLENLKKQDVFRTLNKTVDFRIYRVEHNY